MKIGRTLLSKTRLFLSGRRFLSKKMKKTKKESYQKKKRRDHMVQKLYDTCKEVFVNGEAGYVPPPDHIQRLRSVLDSLKPKDFKFTVPSLEFSSGSGTEEAPLVSYIKLHECDKFSIGMFCLPPSGVIPLHNHPGMTVFCKLLAGTMYVKSYDWVQNHDQLIHSGKQISGIRLAKVHYDSEFTAPCNSSVLFPESGGNMHCFKALTSCILLDVLGPPYSEAQGRKCTYYQDYSYDKFSDHVKEVELEEDGTRYAWLEETDEQFVVLGGTYDGPTIQI